jgi:hypothetical protein
MPRSVSPLQLPATTLTHDAPCGEWRDVHNCSVRNTIRLPAGRATAKSYESLAGFHQRSARAHDTLRLQPRSSCQLYVVQPGETRMMGQNHGLWGRHSFTFHKLRGINKLKSSARGFPAAWNRYEHSSTLARTERGDGIRTHETVLSLTNLQPVVRSSKR